MSFYRCSTLTLFLNLLFFFSPGSHSGKRPTSSREIIMFNKRQGLMLLLWISSYTDNQKVMVDRFINIIALHCRKLAIWSGSTFNFCPYTETSVVLSLCIFRSNFAQKNYNNNDLVCFYPSLKLPCCYRSIKM